ncbi:uncharacterized protein METZ01_LOCUS385629, partial [marine metagenome]
MFFPLFFKANADLGQNPISFEGKMPVKKGIFAKPGQLP